MQNFEAVVGAGSLADGGAEAVPFPHRWTTAGVTVRTTFSGAHLVHLAVAGCVLNDVYREADRLDIAVQGVRVTAGGDFEPDSWRSTGITYEVEIDSDASAERVALLLETVDAVAEIPKAIRAGAAVVRRAPS